MARTRKGCCFRYYIDRAGVKDPNLRTLISHRRPSWQATMRRHLAVAGYLPCCCQVLNTFVVSPVALPALKQVIGGASTVWYFSRPEASRSAALALATGPAIHASGSSPDIRLLRLIRCDQAVFRSCWKGANYCSVEILCSKMSASPDSLRLSSTLCVLPNYPDLNKKKLQESPGSTGQYRN